MSNTAQTHLDTLMAEEQAHLDEIRARRDEEEREWIAKIRQEYDLVLPRMPEELKEYYSFDSGDSSCPLKVSIPKHVEFHVGFWGGSLRHKLCSTRADYGRLSQFIKMAKEYYREPEPEVDERKSTEPAESKVIEPSRVQRAQAAVDEGSYSRAIAIALIEVAVQLSEIDRSLVALKEH